MEIVEEWLSRYGSTARRQDEDRRQFMAEQVRRLLGPAISRLAEATRVVRDLWRADQSNAAVREELRNWDRIRGRREADVVLAETVMRDGGLNPDRERYVALVPWWHAELRQREWDKLDDSVRQEFTWQKVLEREVVKQDREAKELAEYLADCERRRVTDLGE